MQEEKTKKVPLSRLAQLNKPELPFVVGGLAGSTGLGMMMPAFAIAFSSILTVFFSPCGCRQRTETSCCLGALWGFVVLVRVAVPVSRVASSLSLTARFALVVLVLLPPPPSALPRPPALAASSPKPRPHTAHPQRLRWAVSVPPVQPRASSRPACASGALCLLALAWARSSARCSRPTAST